MIDYALNQVGKERKHFYDLLKVCKSSSFPNDLESKSIVTGPANEIH